MAAFLRPMANWRARCGSFRTFLCLLCVCLAPGHVLFLGNLLAGVGSACARNKSFRVSMATSQDQETAWVDIIAPGTPAEKLPTSYVRRWPYWAMQNADDVEQHLLVPVKNPMSDATAEAEGWSFPMSFDELWFAEDLPTPRVQLGICTVVKDGRASYICPAIDVSISIGGNAWYNRGLKTVPLAKRWIDISKSPLESLVLTAYRKKSNSAKWTPILSRGRQIKESFKVLAEAASESKLHSGYHFVTMPMLSSTILFDAIKDLQDGSRVRVFLSSSEKMHLQLEDAPTWEWAELDVELKTVGRGSESEHIPEVYKKLYEDLQLQDST